MSMLSDHKTDHLQRDKLETVMLPFNHKAISGKELLILKLRHCAKTKHTDFRGDASQQHQQIFEVELRYRRAWRLKKLWFCLSSSFAVRVEILIVKETFEAACRSHFQAACFKFWKWIEGWIIFRRGTLHLSLQPACIVTLIGMLLVVKSSQLRSWTCKTRITYFLCNFKSWLPFDQSHAQIAPRTDSVSVKSFLACEPGWHDALYWFQNGPWSRCTKCTRYKNFKKKGGEYNEI